MVAFRWVPVALVVWVALLNQGVSYAADKILLSCLGTRTLLSSGYKSDAGPNSFVVDLDKQIVAWEADSYPIVSSTSSVIKFGSKDDSEGVEIQVDGFIDRVTGTIVVTMETHSLGDATIEPIRVEYSFTCHGTNPVF